jgi:hypothetical protein
MPPAIDLTHDDVRLAELVGFLADHDPLDAFEVLGPPTGEDALERVARAMVRLRHHRER